MSEVFACVMFVMAAASTGFSLWCVGKEIMGKVGDGSRFKELERGLMKNMGKQRADAIAASAGRKKYGKKKFEEMAAKGRRRADG